MFVGSNNSSLPSQQLTELNSQITAARGQQADLQARSKQLREMIRSGSPIESSDIANSEAMRRMNYAVDGEKKDAADVAKDFLQRLGA